MIGKLGGVGISVPLKLQKARSDLPSRRAFSFACDTGRASRTIRNQFTVSAGINSKVGCPPNGSISRSYNRCHDLLSRLRRKECSHRVGTNPEANHKARRAATPTARDIWRWHLPLPITDQSEVERLLVAARGIRLATVADRA
jgi:hypothetical protein